MQSFQDTKCFLILREGFPGERVFLGGEIYKNWGLEFWGEQGKTPSIAVGLLCDT